MPQREGASAARSSDGPDPGSFGGHPYTPQERALGYGTDHDPRFTRSKPDAAPVIESYSIRLRRLVERVSPTDLYPSERAFLLDCAAALEAAEKVAEAYTAESEDWNDGEFALWRKDDLVNAIVALRAAL